jgi:cell division protein FtsB
MERQHLKVGSVAALLAFLLGLAFSFGGKSASVDSLRDEVHDQRSTIETLKTTINTQALENNRSIKGLEDAVQNLTKTVDDMKTQAEMQAQAQADYHAASGPRRR